MQESTSGRSSGPGPPAPPSGSGASAWSRPTVTRLAAGGLALVIIALGLLSRQNQDVFVPGEAPNAEARVTIGAAVHHRPGSIHLLTVGVYYGVQTWRVLLADLNPEDAVYSETAYPDTPGQETIAMDTSQHDGAVAAFGEIYGYQSLKIDGLLLVGLASDTPAAKVLRPGDVITSADGQALTTATASTQLESIVQSHAVGQTVHLSVLRGGRMLSFDVPVVHNPYPAPPGSSTPAPKRVIGVQIEPDYILPVPVKIDAGGIGGPSAGLSWALSIVNLLGPKDLTRGRIIADTGTMDYQGNVGPIGGIQQKVYGAEAVGATILICPAGQNLTDARATVAASHYKMNVIGVSTLHQAVAALTAP